MLKTHSMVKPLIIDTFGPTYKKNLECCKLNQALLWTHGSSCALVPSGLWDPASPQLLARYGSKLSNSLPMSPRYMHYPKSSGNSFQNSSESLSLCVHCGIKGHRAATCSFTQSSHLECPLIVLWQNGQLEMADGNHICLQFNIRVCSFEPSECHGSHSCPLCSDTCHGGGGCTRN